MTPRPWVGKRKVHGKFGLNHVLANCSGVSITGLNISSRLSCNTVMWHAHQGEPGNELVDCLAYQAADGKPLHDLQPWLDTVTEQTFVESAEWMWYLFRHDLNWDGSVLNLPAGPKTTPNDAVFQPSFSGEQASSPDTNAQLDVKLATCNVLSLKPPCRSAGSDDVVANTIGPARQDALLRQFHEAGVHVFAWQETRLKRCSNQHDDRYWLFRSPATAHGHYGTIIGLQRLLPIGTIGTDKIYIHEHEVSVITAAPRVLILRLNKPIDEMPSHCCTCPPHRGGNGVHRGLVEGPCISNPGQIPELG